MAPSPSLALRNDRGGHGEGGRWKGRGGADERMKLTSQVSFSDVEENLKPRQGGCSSSSAGYFGSPRGVM